MEEPAEPVEGEEFEELGAPRKRKFIKLLAVVIAVIIAGVAVWFLAFSNIPPTADFTVEVVNRYVTVSAENARDPEGAIASYLWDWGDGTPQQQGIWRNHTYAQEGDYTITLSVVDGRGASSVASRDVTIEVLPIASFVARHEATTVAFDASASTSENGAITSYSWDFGDGTTGTGPTVTHEYTAAGRYTVELEVTDASGTRASARHYVSPAATTVDIYIDGLFEAGCPYRDYWEFRFAASGEQILNNTVPCRYFYPWVLWQDAPEENPSWVYTQYRFDAMVRNHPGYTLNDPVILPIFNSTVTPDANSFIEFDLSLLYVGPELMAQYSIPGGFGDGWASILSGNITMDFNTAKRIFDVGGNTPAQAQVWWWNNTRSGRLSGTIETRLQSWLDLTANSKYDIWNGYEWYYQPDVTDLNGTVDPVTGLTTVRLFHDGWGPDALFFRWWYWGKADYRQSVNSAFGAVPPQGWMPMETCWCEDPRMSGSIDAAGLDLDYRAVQTYNLQAWGNWGPDGIPGTGDDLPAWALSPFLADYVPRLGSGQAGESAYPNSELRWYEGLRAYHGTPGSFSYGQLYDFTVPPTRLSLSAGSTVTIVLPKFEVAWFDPVRSRYDPSEGIGDYYGFFAPMTLRVVTADDQPVGPGSFYLWDARSKTISIAGPHNWAETDLPLVPTPWIEFRPESVGPGQDL